MPFRVSDPISDQPKNIRIKRINDPPADDDGDRVLVDRLWPRGVKKEDAKIDLWAEEIAPSADLRKWFDHDAVKFDEFRTRYLDELRANSDAVNTLLTQAANQNLTLLYSARDTNFSQAVVLRDYLAGM